MKTLKRCASNFLRCVFPRKLETIEEDDEDDLEIWFLSEIIEDILSRLPVKSILQFRSVSKPWLLLISDPTFTRLQLTRATIAFFIHAYDPCTCKRYFLSATHDSGSVTHLMTLDHKYRMVVEAVEHLNGLVCYSSPSEVFVLNPSMHKVFKLPETGRCNDCIAEANEVHILILNDYENNVWVTKTITFPESWRTSDCFLPLDYVNMDEIIFSLRKLSWNVIGAPIYNMKTGCFRLVQFTLDHPFLCESTVEFHQIKCYVESIVPLPKDLMMQKKSFFHEQKLCLKKFLGYKTK